MSSLPALAALAAGFASSRIPCSELNVAVSLSTWETSAWVVTDQNPGASARSVQYTGDSARSRDQTASGSPPRYNSGSERSGR